MDFKTRKLLLTLRVKVTEPRNPTGTKAGSSTSSRPGGTAKKPKDTSTHDYDPLYVDSSGEEDQMEDIQESSSLGWPVSTSPENILTRCFNELLKSRNEVSLIIML